MRDVPFDRFIKGTCPKCRSTDQYGDACEKCGTTNPATDLVDPYSVLTGAKPEPAFLITKPFQPETVKAAIGQEFFDVVEDRLAPGGTVAITRTDLDAPSGRSVGTAAVGAALIVLGAPAVPHPPATQRQPKAHGGA